MATGLQSLLRELPTFDASMAPGLDAEIVELAPENLGTDLPLAGERFPFAPPGDGAGVPAKSFPKTVGAMCQTSTLGEAFDALNFPAELRDPLLNLVGAQETSEASVIASLPFDAFREAVSQDLYLESGDKPTLFQQGRFYKFFKDLGKALAEPAPPSAPTSSGTAQPIVLTLPDTNNRIPLRDVLDQTMSGTFTVLPEKEISELRKNYVTRTGMAPTSAERPTDEQLSALA